MTTFVLGRRGIRVLFRGICAMFIWVGWGGAAARMREEVRKRGGTTPGFYTPVP
jgi:hypothetical protein